MVPEFYRTLTLGQWEKVLALTAPVTRTSQGLTEHAQPKVYDFGSPFALENWGIFELLMADS